MKASELAYKAAQEMAERGHCKNISEDAEGRVCFYGAVSRAEGIEPMQTLSILPSVTPLASYSYYHPAEFTLTFGDGKTAISAASGGPYAAIPADSPEKRQLTEAVKAILHEGGIPEWDYPHMWNDREDVTGEDVILVLKEAGSRLEARGC